MRWSAVVRKSWSSTPVKATNSEAAGARDWRLIAGTGTVAGLPDAEPGGIGVSAARTAPLHVGAAPGALNMAIDHALMESVQSGGAPALRLYAWDPPCLSFGRNQHVRGLYDPDQLAAAGVDVVRRPTGGLAVLHDVELTYCVVAPADLFGGPRAAYMRISEALLEGLRLAGVSAGLAAAAGAPDPRRDAANPCFHAPAAGEIVAGGRKLVGSAQRCERRTILQHGSILLGGTQQVVAELLREAQPGAPGGATSVEAILGRATTPSELAPFIVAGLEARCGIRLAPDGLARGEELRIRELEEVYGAAEWTWRR